MKEIVADPALVAACGLYCGACKRYLEGSCPGCAANEKATWCKVRTCCRDADIATCAECTQHTNPKDCAKLNNFVARIFGLILNSNRGACILRIREVGAEDYAAEMAASRRQSLPRRP